ncbi:hypothetical protein C2G38_2142554 [Gigaspora rosea]|uniref:Uncharacterized protein n=1 Tax=Gigaspora rosea TaxID=44941 RepID=A0A397V6P5_9GLOM|nr:hypothetical protein C2G38_2142554 [Gigaspora rosea]
MDFRRFLKECKLKSTRAKLGLYVKCLKMIISTETGQRRAKAQELLKNYREGEKPVRKYVKTSLIKIQNTCSGGSQTIETTSINGLSEFSKKRGRKEDNETQEIKENSKTKGKKAILALNEFRTMRKKKFNRISKGDLTKNMKI